MSTLFADLLRTLAHGLFWGYGSLVAVHLVGQVVAAAVHRRMDTARHHRALAVRGRRWPSVDVVVPVYNEDPADLERCCAALLAQDYPGPLTVALVDDGSPNRADVLPVLERYGALPGWRVLLPDANAGKRHAQHLAMTDCAGELVLTIDSDTQVAPDGVRRMVEPFDDPRVGAVTGSVRVSNAGTNLLTRLIDLRYWVAFHQERASHALAGAVLCCSGPLSMYRRPVLAKVWRRYVAQEFRGAPCTYGDDRHLTNLVLAEGWRTVFAPRAECITSAPTTLRGYLKQQTRWNKSYYRELLWTLAFLPRLSRLMAAEVLLQAVLPFLLTAALLATAWRAVEEGPQVLVRYALVVAVMAVAHCLYGLVRTRDPRFLLFVAYGFLHACLLVPVRLRALTSLSDTSWGTREALPGPGARRDRVAAAP